MSNVVLKLPTLYKKTATGAIQQWTVSVRTQLMVETYNIGVVTTEYGQVNGQMQTTEDIVHEGKNLGKANATTPVGQAKLQAQQQWDKKRKQGYVTVAQSAALGETGLDAIKPMLAHVYEDHPKKVSWPAFVQPKLDGMRCIAIVKEGVCKLYSRTQKLITTVPHINAAVEILAGGENLILDGELYNHELKHDFNRIMSIIKRDEVHPDHKLVQYHVYDMPSVDSTFLMRGSALQTLFSKNICSCLVRVNTVRLVSEDELMETLGRAIEDGYEGVMYRGMHSMYEGKRSHALLKVKTFKDEEFRCIGVEEGNGKLQGKAGAIWCVTSEGKPFKAKMQGTLDSLTDYLVNKVKYEGRSLTVKFQNYTPDGIPRFPVGIRFREAE